MQYTVYAIISEKDGRIYVGFSKNVRDRVKQHNQGTTKSTKAYRPWTLLFEKAVSSRQEARRLEKYYKSGCGKEYLKSLTKAP